MFKSSFCRRSMLGLLMISCFFSMGVASCKNYLSEFATPESDEALFYEAKQFMSAGSWTLAIQNFQAMSATYIAKREVKLWYAKAYAGRCGLGFFDFIQDLGGIGVSRLLPVLMQAYTGAVVTNSDDCTTSESLITEIGATAADRTVDENLTMLLVSFSKVGAILSVYGDADANGVLDAGFDACAAGSLPDAAAQHVGSGLAIGLSSLQAISSQISIGGSSVADLTGVCSALEGIDPNLNFCNDTDPTGITGTKLSGVRTIINENQDIGVGSCTGDVSACPCP